MRQALQQMLLAATAGVAVAVAAVGAAAPAVATESGCDTHTPAWEVTWTSGGASTLRTCGGEAPVPAVDPAGPPTSEPTAASRGHVGGREELPETSGTVPAVVGIALALTGLGSGLYLLARRRRAAFTA